MQLYNFTDNKINNRVKKSSNSVYEIVGVTKEKSITYKTGTLKQIIDNELLENSVDIIHETIDDVVRDMDIFSSYKHYYRIVK